MVCMFATPWRTAGTAASVIVVSTFWEREVSNGHHPGGGTHIEDLKDLLQVQLPDGNCLSVFVRVEMSRDRIPFTPLDELLLNVCHNPAIERAISDGSRYVSLVKLTPTTDLLHHTRTDRLRPVSFRISPARALGRHLHKIIRVRVHSPPSPSCV